jgi:cell division protein FtsW (lipid II flippase)
MGCEYEKCKKTFLVMLAITTILCIVMAGYGGYSSTQQPIEAAKSAYYAVIAFAVIGIFISICGFCACKTKNRALFLVYGTLSLIVMLLFFIMGIVLFSAGGK